MPSVLQLLNPTYSTCGKCKIPWNWCTSKTVMYNSHSGTFATCQHCWDNSSLEELKGYYTKVYRMQQKSLIGTTYTIEHTLEHLLGCVEEEYIKTK